MKFELYNIETAPEGSKALLKNSIKTFGMIPNLHAVLAESPQTLEAYQLLHGLFQQSSFNEEELTVVWQTINVEHECHYCVPAHTAIANMMKVDEAITHALREQNPLQDPKLQVLHQTTLALVRNRGHLTEEQHSAFIDAGYERRQLLEIILGISQKVISNYVNHQADTPVDKPFQKFLWKK
mgnify:CR=1 FL=1